MTPIEGMKAKAETDAAVDAIQELIRNARPVPLTDQVRLKPKEMWRLLTELRDALTAERRARG